MSHAYYGETIRDEGDEARVEVHVAPGGLGDYSLNASDWEAYLDHSCDDWCIGGRKQILEMIADLTKALENPKLIEDSSKS